MNVATILGIIMLFVLLSIPTVFREKFQVVASNEPAVPRDEIDSVGYLQLRPAYQRGLRHHANAAYFEVDNHTFEIALQEALKFSCRQGRFRREEWLQEVQPQALLVSPNLLKEYNALLAYITTSLNKLVKSERFQMVHDRWITFRSHVSSKTKTLFTFEVLLYRTGKFQGKHVTFTAVVDTAFADPSQRYTILQTKVEGVVSEDKIGLFPINAATHNPLENHATVPSHPLDNYPSILIDKNTVEKTIEQQREKLNRGLAAQLLII